MTFKNVRIDGSCGSKTRMFLGNIESEKLSEDFGNEIRSIISFYYTGLLFGSIEENWKVIR